MYDVDQKNGCLNVTISSANNSQKDKLSEYIKSMSKLSKYSKKQRRHTGKRRSNSTVAHSSQNDACENFKNVFKSNINFYNPLKQSRKDVRNTSKYYIGNSINIITDFRIRESTV